ncbi:hypothetical protein [Aquisphaera insulae]|uniref:hypothetical protein n=1 Tax=Aquisphaera insulae TaxID=2712864 RepID=UPI0013EDC31F|nr:hypothetical protein [Aquisphaera insulae]
MTARMPIEVTNWVIREGAWQKADPKVDIAHYTNATLFSYQGRVIDGRVKGLTDEEFDALRAKYPNDVIGLADGSFDLPFVPVGTIINLDPEPAPAPAPAGATPKPAAGRARRKASR